MAARMAIILSQGQSQGQNHSSAKRHLEENIAAGLASDPTCAVMLIPPLYDLPPGSPAFQMLRELPGDFVLLSWLYPRAAHWTLDRHHVRGQLIETPLIETPLESGVNELREHGAQPQLPDADQPRVLDRRPAPDRRIYHLDLRTREDPRVFVQEVRRIVAERGGALADRSAAASPPADSSHHVPAATLPARRWYPVIDYSRCTNCMECIDFCLFGVFGVDHQETILVEQPDNCRRGCPACSRVCPENAIIFPRHKTPLIAGGPGVASAMKLDLSQLFGRPAEQEVAARERDEHLRRSGRATVPSAPEPREHDILDELIDELDQMDL